VRDFCIEYIRNTDGVNVFPKLEVHVRTYLKLWQRNRRIQDAFEGMKGRLAVLDNVNKKYMPAELRKDNEKTGDSDTNDDDGGGVMFGDDSCQDESMLVWQTARMPEPVEEPAEQARIAPGTCTIVGTTSLGTTDLNISAMFSRIPGQRGKDITGRRKRRCARCLLHGDDEQRAENCPGRGARMRCQHFDESGNQKLTINVTC